MNDQRDTAPRALPLAPALAHSRSPCPRVASAWPTHSFPSPPLSTTICIYLLLYYATQLGWSVLLQQPRFTSVTPPSLGCLHPRRHLSALHPPARLPPPPPYTHPHPAIAHSICYGTAVGWKETKQRAPRPGATPINSARHPRRPPWRAVCVRPPASRRPPAGVAHPPAPQRRKNVRGPPRISLSINPSHTLSFVYRCHVYTVSSLVVLSTSTLWLTPGTSELALPSAFCPLQPIPPSMDPQHTRPPPAAWGIALSPRSPTRHH